MSRGTLRPRVIFCNDGATLTPPGIEAPIDAATFIEETLGMLRDGAVDTLYWQLGADPFKGTASHRLSDWYTHDTEVGSVWGSDRSRFRTAGEWRMAENAKSLSGSGRDAVGLVIEHGHAQGLDVFISLRINDGSDSTLPELTDINVSPHRRDHPGWLLGDEGHRHRSMTPRQQRHVRFAYDFALPEVRRYTLGLIVEIIARHPLDGFDIDFCRQPGLFKRGQARQSGPLITGLLADVRRALDRGKTRNGGRRSLSVRVPPDIEANLDAGLDVGAWIDEGIVDIVVVGDPGGYNYRLPIEAFLALAEGTDCRIVAQNLCGFREEPLRSEAVLFGQGGAYSADNYRAAAALHWQAGAHGQYIWNQHLIRFVTDAGYVADSWRDIGDPDRLARQDKHYIVGPTGRGGVLPVALELDQSAVVNVESADGSDVEEPPTVVLRLMIEQLTVLDVVSISFAGRQLSRCSARQRLNYNDCWLDFDIDQVRRGDNALGLHVTRRNPHVEAPLVLRAVHLFVRYPASSSNRFSLRPFEP